MPLNRFQFGTLLFIILLLYCPLSINAQPGSHSIVKDSEQEANLSSKIVESKEADRVYYMVRDKVRFSEIQSFISTYHKKLLEVVKTHHIALNGAPSVLYYSWDEKEKIADMAAALPINEYSIPEGSFVITAQFNMKRVILKEGFSLLLDYHGPLDEIGIAHDAMHNCLQSRGYIKNGPVIEEYVTDSKTAPDPGKQVTRLYYPFKKQ